MRLADKLVVVAAALRDADVPYAFGGAIALGYALREPRATNDLDVNIFVPSTSGTAVLATLPMQIAHDADDVRSIERDEQVRLWWDRTPVDLFFSASSFHDDVASRARSVPFADTTIRILAATDLATFKVLFDRTKDWLDLRLMWESGTLDVAEVSRQLTDLLGDDRRIGRLQQIGR